MPSLPQVCFCPDISLPLVVSAPIALPEPAHHTYVCVHTAFSSRTVFGSSCREIHPMELSPEQVPSHPAGLRNICVKVSFISCSLHYLSTLGPCKSVPMEFRLGCSGVSLVLDPGWLSSAVLGALALPPSIPSRASSLSPGFGPSSGPQPSQVPLSIQSALQPQILIFFSILGQCILLPPPTFCCYIGIPGTLSLIRNRKSLVPVAEKSKLKGCPSWGFLSTKIPH